MHGNRETSETPAVKVSRRSAGEGKSHTARDREKRGQELLKMQSMTCDTITEFRG